MRSIRDLLLVQSLARSGSVRTVAVFLASTAMLFAGFCGNIWRTAKPEQFDAFQIGWESFIVGRMLKTKADGLFSAGGLTGLAGPEADPPNTDNPNYRFQYQAYRESLPIQSYAAYKSQPGGQGMLFGALDGLLPLAPDDKLALFHGLTSLLSAAVLGILIAWLYREFGWAAGLAALAGTLLSQWLTLFGRNLWWSIWAFFLPMLIVLRCVNRAGDLRKLSPVWFGAVVFLAVLVKCFFNGYEYVTTTLVMMVCPFVYRSAAQRIGWKPFLRGLASAVVASVLAVLASMTVLCLQISAVEGNFAAGIDHIVFSLLRRSYADSSFFPPDYAASLNANVLDVAGYYLREIYFDLNYYLRAPNDWIANFLFQFRYLYLIAIFAAASAAFWFLTHRNADRELRDRGRGLIAALWFSLLAPLSWFVIFKAHSYVHTFLNDIVWQMPFTILGFAMCGLTLRGLWGIRRRRAD
jgi:hypothetical protein